MAGTVTVMNASYEIISRTSVKRAMAMIMREMAVIEEADPLRELRHKAGSFPWPKVVRLLRYVKVPFKYGDAPWSKQGVLRRDDHACGYCGKRATTVDHVYPQSRGGKDTWLNTVAACTRCNAKKRDRTLDECGMILTITPYAVKRVGFLTTR